MNMKKILIIAGEASGDLIGANLITKLKTKCAACAFIAMGGNLIRKTGANIILDSNELAFIGIVDVLKNLHKIFSALRIIKKTIHKQRPDLIILIDYPGFNLRIAKIAKKAGIKVLYYVSPQIWAWHKNRINIIKRYVYHMAVILPFETEIYQKAKIPVAFVGHPLLEIIKTTHSCDEIKKSLGISHDKIVVGLMPGSRQSEIKYLLPTILKAAKLIQNRYPNIQFVMPLASSRKEEDLTQYFHDYKLPIRITKNNNYDVMKICDAIVAASGTATLEITILNIPLVIVFKTSALNAFIGRKLIQVPYFGLANLIAGKKIIPELIQEAATAEAIFNEINLILEDKFYASKMITDMNSVKMALNAPIGTNIETMVKKILEL